MNAVSDADVEAMFERAKPPMHLIDVTRIDSAGPTYMMVPGREPPTPPACREIFTRDPLASVRQELITLALCLATGCGLACVFLAIYAFLSVVAPR